MALGPKDLFEISKFELSRMYCMFVLFHSSATMKTCLNNFPEYSLL